MSALPHPALFSHSVECLTNILKQSRVDFLATTSRRNVLRICIATWSTLSFHGHPSLGLPYRVLGGSRFGISSMDRGSRPPDTWTSAASPAEPGELPCWFSGLIVPGDTLIDAPPVRALIIRLAASHRLPPARTPRRSQYNHQHRMQSLLQRRSARPWRPAIRVPPTGEQSGLIRRGFACRPSSIRTLSRSSTGLLRNHQLTALAILDLSKAPRAVRNETTFDRAASVEGSGRRLPSAHCSGAASHYDDRCPITRAITGPTRPQSLPSSEPR